MAICLWEKCKSPLVAGIAASCLYGKLHSSLGEKNTELRNQYNKQQETFEKLSCDVSLKIILLTLI